MSALENNADVGRWVRRFHPAPDAGIRLVCLPHAGGSASFFFPASRSLAPMVDVAAIQYPGRQDRRSEPGIDDLHELADQVFHAVRPLAELPLALFGHSMGATISFEVARRLEADGVVPAALFASGRRAPSRHRKEWVHLRDDDELLAEITALSGTESLLLGDEDVLRMILPAIRNDYRAAETYRYRPGPKLSCPIFAFIGDSDPKSTIEEARAWGEHTTGRFDLQVFSGGHFYLNSCALTVLNTVREQLASRVGCPPARNT
ncbi:thioesterase II family protein [Amycolatopsis anabasis]|uniref:thioesterase II family protein n=1 Tax=Amycolatopsis anabasis TaxID=1840409 RepID=UPI00131CCDAC|nr:alpha/beta fold hydrolase [Amycolatopsis anabasis]